MFIQTAKDVVQKLNGQVSHVAKYLLSNGKKKGSHWHVGSIAGEHGESLKLCLEGNDLGLWFDHATGQGGDLLDLWQSVKGMNFKEALNDAKDWLGIKPISFETNKKIHFKKPVLTIPTESYNHPKLQDYLVKERKLNPDTIKSYGIEYNTLQDAIIFKYQINGETLLIKQLGIDRENGKKKIWSEKDCQPCLFGWQVLNQFPNARKIILTEGELDAMSLYQYDLPYPALSLPFGGGEGAKHEWIEHEFDRLKDYDEIILCLDNDAVGQQTAQFLARRLGRHKCLVMTLPYKDANECLLQNVPRETILTCLRDAKIQEPTQVKSPDEDVYISSVYKTFYPSEEEEGYRLPWMKSHRDIRFRPNELTIWTGINGHGKSLILGHILIDMMEQGAKVCVASMEMAPHRLLHRMVRQVAIIKKPSPNYIVAIQNYLATKMKLFEHLGITKKEIILDAFQYCHLRYGTDVFVIDSLMKCGIKEENLDDQKDFVDALCDFKHEYPVHIHLVAHTKKKADESEIPGKLDIKGSGAISDLADNCLSVFRCKTANENEGSKNPPTAYLKCDKQRNGEWEGIIGLWFHPDSFQYLESEHAKPHRYLHVSFSTNDEDIQKIS